MIDGLCPDAFVILAVYAAHSHLTGRVVGRMVTIHYLFIGKGFEDEVVAFVGGTGQRLQVERDWLLAVAIGLVVRLVW